MSLLWMNDERSVLVIPPPIRRIPLRIERLDIETGRRSLFAEIAPKSRAGLAHILVTDVVADGRSYAYDTYWRLSTLFVINTVAPGSASGWDSR
jgi:hypothetical protein